MNFVLFICKQLDPTAPSLHRLKSITLPGFRHPQQVCIWRTYLDTSSYAYDHASTVQFYSSSGMPFYMNMPELAVVRVLADPVIAEQLHRYPVLTQGGPVRYNTYHKNHCNTVVIAQTPFTQSNV